MLVYNKKIVYHTSKEANEHMMKKRFKNILSQHSTPSLIITSSKPKVFIQHDVAYDYEPGPTFRWLTRCDAHPCIIAMTPHGELHAFLSPHQPSKWLWEGPQIDISNIGDIKVDHVHTLSDFNTWLISHLPHIDTLIAEADDTVIGDILHTASTDHITYYDLHETVKILRQQKDAWEIQQLQLATDISIQSHLELMRHAHQDPHESAILGRFLLKGYQSNNQSLAYTPIIASGANATVLHYSDNNRMTQHHDWLLIDAAWRVNGYCSDITRSYPLNKNANGLKRHIYQLVLHTQQTIIEIIAPGCNWTQLTTMARSILTEGLIDLKILSHDTASNINKYFPHGLGHWLGLDVHDQNPYKTNHKQPIPWTPGMVLTIEPGLYFPENDMNVPEAIRGFGIRIEDDILITPSGCRNLSAALPVHLDDIAHV